ncbi:MAG: hypothetical protein K6F05_04190 [Succinivibrio sp.]|nr:hypothetical protein [Succinivibrio sp.]
MQEVNNNDVSYVNNVNTDFRPSGIGKSVQMMFAELQLMLAKNNKEAAGQIIDNIKASQACSRQYAQTITEFRGIAAGKVRYNITDAATVKKDLETCKQAISTYNQMIADIKSGKLKPFIDEYKNPCYKMPEPLFSQMTEMAKRAGIDKFPDMTRGNDNKHMLYELEGGLKEIQQYAKYLGTIKSALDLGIPETQIKGTLDDRGIDKIVQNLQTMQDTVGSDIQQKMIYVQDHMGQYNAYTQGANTAISQSNQVLTAVARGQ